MVDLTNTCGYKTSDLHIAYRCCECKYDVPIKSTISVSHTQVTNQCTNWKVLHQRNVHGRTIVKLWVNSLNSLDYVSMNELDVNFGVRERLVHT